MKIKKIAARTAVIILLLCSAIPITAQKVAIKTNVLYDATTTINAGLEFALSPKWSLDISGNYNPWTFSDNKKWKHWLVQPELRYWTCNKMMGHFFSIHALGGQFNAGNWSWDPGIFGKDVLKDYRVEGWMAGAGIAYGYAWVLGKHFNIEAEIGVGYVYFNYDKFKCERCGEKIETDKDKHYLGPTKAALNLVYVF